MVNIILYIKDFKFINANLYFPYITKSNFMIYYDFYIYYNK